MATTSDTFPHTNMAPGSAMVTRAGGETDMYVSPQPVYGMLTSAGLAGGNAVTRIDQNLTPVHALASRGAG